MLPAKTNRTSEMQSVLRKESLGEQGNARADNVYQCRYTSRMSLEPREFPPYSRRSVRVTTEKRLDGSDACTAAKLIEIDLSSVFARNLAFFRIELDSRDVAESTRREKERTRKKVKDRKKILGAATRVASHT